MNKVILIGRLTADPEIKQTQTGKSNCSFSIAVDRNMGKDREKTADFIRCVAWGSQAEFISKYFTKGKQIAIEGNIKTGSYEKDGVKHFTTDVWVERVEFVGSKGSSDGGTNTAQTSSNNSPNTQANTNDYEPLITDEDIPF